VHSDFTALSLRWPGGKIEKQGGNVLISFLLKGSLLEGKSMSLFKFFCCLGVYLELCEWLKLI
jgi:hypothetical protein